MRGWPAATAVILLASACGPSEPIEMGQDGAGDTGTPAAQMAPSCAELTDESPVDGPLADDEEVAEAQRARAEYGLASDAQTTADVMVSTDEDDWAFGFPLSEDEQDEIMARGTDEQASAEEVRAWAVEERREDFAGLWLDQPTGGTLHVAFAAEVDQHREDVHGRFGEQIRVEAADHSLAELEAVADDITAAAEPDHDAEPAPGQILGWGVHEQVNRVSVSVLGGDDQALADLSARYGADTVCLDVQEPPEPYDPDGQLMHLAKVDGWREGLAADGVYRLAEVAPDRDTAQQAWEDIVPSDLPERTGAPEEPGVYGHLDEVDFESQVIVIWSSGESGTCPEWLSDLDVTGADDFRMEIDTASVGACTDDFNPYRMIVAVERDRVPEANSPPITNPDAQETLATYPHQP